jgi:hypothetical protein
MAVRECHVTSAARRNIKKAGAIAENAAVELPLRSRNSVSQLQQPFDLFAQGSETGD